MPFFGQLSAIKEDDDVAVLLTWRALANLKVMLGRSSLQTRRADLSRLDGPSDVSAFFRPSRTRAGRARETPRARRARRTAHTRRST